MLGYSSLIHSALMHKHGKYNARYYNKTFLIIDQHCCPSETVSGINIWTANQILVTPLKVGYTIIQPTYSIATVTRYTKSPTGVAVFRMKAYLRLASLLRAPRRSNLRTDRCQI